MIGREEMIVMTWQGSGSLAFRIRCFAAVGSSTERDSENCIRVY